MTRRICLLGLGEVGSILAEDLSDESAGLSAWDPRISEPGSRPARTAAERPLRAGRDTADAVQSADIVISAVTAAQTTAAATAAAPALREGAWYVDLNSASPGSKLEAAKTINAGGGRYVEVAVMGPFPPERLAAPMLLGGPHAYAFLPLAHELGFSGASFFSHQPGRAAALKMCRSVVVKGMEALLLESLLAARAHGVEEAVLASLDNVVPGADWPGLAGYMISRSLEHGARRAEEMREVARTVSETGLAPLVSAACAERQDWAAAFAAERRPTDLEQMLDAIRERMAEGERTKAAR